jgi:hypothetical protein
MESKMFNVPLTPVSIYTGTASPAQAYVRRAVTTLLVTTTVIFGTLVSSRASTVSYAFGPNETIGFFDGHIETITGGFSVNLPVTQFGLTANVTLAGAGPEAGNYTAIETEGPKTILFGGSAGSSLDINFASNFGASTDAITGGVWRSGVTIGGIPIEPERSTAVARAVPEITTWAMMLLGFAGIGFLAYRRNTKPALNAA